VRELAAASSAAKTSASAASLAAVTSAAAADITSDNAATADATTPTAAATEATTTAATTTTAAFVTTSVPSPPLPPSPLADALIAALRVHVDAMTCMGRNLFKQVRNASPCDAISCCALYAVQRHVTSFRVAPERVHKSYFRSLCDRYKSHLNLLCNIFKQVYGTWSEDEHLKRRITYSEKVPTADGEKKVVKSELFGAVGFVRHCRAFRRAGGCKDGDACQYEHAADVKCRFFAEQGRCFHGDKCRYGHV
jgi:hypothetical protein